MPQSTGRLVADGEGIDSDMTNTLRNAAPIPAAGRSHCRVGGSLP